LLGRTATDDDGRVFELIARAREREPWTRRAGTGARWWASRSAMRLARAWV